MILCSAIKFHIDKTNKEVILCGLRHGDIFKQLEALGFEPHKGYKEIEQGFLTNSGRFLSRKEAYVAALKCGQLKNSKEKEELFSEDLW